MNLRRKHCTKGLPGKNFNIQPALQAKLSGLVNHKSGQDHSSVTFSKLAWMQKTLLLFLLSLIILNSFAQRFGGNPTETRWQQLNTDTARIIFPKGLDSQAQRVAGIIHHLASAQPSSLGKKLYKINVLLQNETTVPNAYVGLGPFRSEFFLNPPASNFDQGTIPWNDQLALHEYRHVQQFNNFRRGLSKAMYTLFGQEGYALAINAAVPDWFFEGDAVYFETILSKQGRGRLPLFLNAYPTLWRAGKDYSWMKLRNGSLKDYVPDHYHLGYLLVNYGAQKYGKDFWTKVTSDAAAYKGLLYPFQKAVKKYAGVDYKTFVKEAFEFYKNDISRNAFLRDTASRPGQALMQVNTNVVTSYFFPYSISADSVIYLKAANNIRPAFYIRDGNGEKMLRVRDISLDQQFSYRNGKLVYASFENDPRWGWRDYSVIRLLDIYSNHQKSIRFRTKYFTPDISPTGSRLAAVQVASTGKSELHILNSNDGELITSIKSNDVALFTDPKFIDDSSLVCIVRLRDGKTALAIANLNSGSLERLTPPSFSVLGYPNISEGKVYFTAAFELNNDDLFVLDLNDRKISRLTSGTTGRYFVNVAHGKITWSEFTSEGYQLRQARVEDLQPIAFPEENIEKLKPGFAVSGESSAFLANIPAKELEAKHYSKATGFINFHSWRPYYEDPEFSFSLYGENILNTTQTELYYLYNQNENTHAAGFNFTYGGWFPYLGTGANYTFGRQQLIAGRLRQWDELDSRIGFNIPLSWTSGRSFKQLNFGSSYVYRQQFNKGVNKNLFSNFNFSYLSHFISWSQQVQRAVQHIYPRLGYNINLSHRHAITNYTSFQPLITSSIYLPGAFRSHSVVLNAAFQETDTLNVLFANRFPYARGYNEFYFARMWKVGANYHFPLVYPDFGFANILYFQRIRGNLFFDYMKVYSPDKSANANQRSVGGEMYFDTKWWNQYALTFGIRLSRLLDNDFATRTKNTVFEFILPVSIIPR